MRRTGSLVLCACAGPTPVETREEPALLRKTMEQHLPEYRKSVENENRLIEDSLAWLQTDAITAPRAAAVSAARQWADRWIKVYFVPRYFQERRQGDRYRTTPAREAQKQILTHLKARYFELHDYSRYGDHAAASAMHNTPAGRLPAPPEEVKERLEARAQDQITPLLAQLQN